MVLNINDDELVGFTNRLEKLGGTVLPTTVKQALDFAAFDVKGRTMPEESNRFVHRKPTFFKANSTVVKANGVDIGSMQSEVGFKPKPGDKSHSVEDLEQQEHGGEIDNRAFIALPGARVGKSMNRMVRKQLTLATIGDKIVDSLDARGKNNSEKFIKSAIHAGKGGFVLGTDRKKGSRMLMYINSVKRLAKSVKTKAGKEYSKGDTVVNSTAVYDVRKGRKVSPDDKYHGFMRTASYASAQKMETEYKRRAERKINSLLKKNI